MVAVTVVVAVAVPRVGERLAGGQALLDDRLCKAKERVRGRGKVRGGVGGCVGGSAAYEAASVGNRHRMIQPSHAMNQFERIGKMWSSSPPPSPPLLPPSSSSQSSSTLI